MNIRLISMAAAAAFLIVATPGPQAQATAAKVPMLKTDTSELVEVRKKRRYKARRHFRRHHRAHRHRHYRRHRHHRRWRYRGPRFSIYLGGASRCAWLRRRAYVTGSRYWWRRYRRCRAYW